jgi:hypothetical protein
MVGRAGARGVGIGAAAAGLVAWAGIVVLTPTIGRAADPHAGAEVAAAVLTQAQGLRISALLLVVAGIALACTTAARPPRATALLAASWLVLTGYDAVARVTAAPSGASAWSGLAAGAAVAVAAVVWGATRWLPAPDTDRGRRALFGFAALVPVGALLPVQLQPAAQWEASLPITYAAAVATVQAGLVVTAVAAAYLAGPPAGQRGVLALPFGTAVVVLGTWRIAADAPFDVFLAVGVLLVVVFLLVPALLVLLLRGVPPGRVAAAVAAATIVVPPVVGAVAVLTAETTGVHAVAWLVTGTPLVGGSTAAVTLAGLLLAFALLVVDALARRAQPAVRGASTAPSVASAARPTSSTGSATAGETNSISSAPPAPMSAAVESWSASCEADVWNPTSPGADSARTR